MSLLERLQGEMRASMRARDTLCTNILKLVISDASRLESTPGHKGAVTDSEVHKIIGDVVKGNNETLSKLPAGDPRIEALEAENAILKPYLPVMLTKGQILASIADLVPQIKAARSNGEATGMVMKHFKSTGDAVKGSDVTDVIKEIREMA